MISYAAAFIQSELPLWRLKKKAKLNAKDSGDAFDHFQTQDTEQLIHAGPLPYWISQLQTNPANHELALMGIELASIIPAMSSDVECLFSSAKFLISDRRANLGDEVVEASECLKSWASAGLVFDISSTANQILSDLLQQHTSLTR